ncbi:MULTISPECIES: FKBP-type peptidyl-prolyl cis-trans isomerase [unclassified Chryseobacterium]|uniref:FKBP-type peptidyl-prolyl cis-trans isomerase n=1 Tax=unclassified Chryseobacterium TaxID=2593645 RepID=UPI001AE69FDE|nr:MULTISPECIES: FKBP-type peptidyl-prolyl cis-trans isomerase [unclassified Chryseobacterium]MBP1164372.1 FKBP-type peptidyl-prolyl cis-trans isomerase [Chryseobacterium sp. PvR013]MDR4890531.1 FKBP-type peptidyl-prolyl cis-trans isomerase [Chryseobacterium sp. CFS7]
MKKILFISAISLLSCNRNAQTAHPPVGGVLSQKDLDVSRNRMKNLNTIERGQIQDWISGQSVKYYPTQLNYWVTVEGYDQRERRKDETTISYSYDLYDFDQTKIYDQPFERRDARFGHFDELRAVENALRFIRDGEEVTLLVPSSLAYGTYGDEKKIDNDIPLIIKLKAL